jgi:intracellular sulfur oxidation DsrE/DsrF family protein
MYKIGELQIESEVSMNGSDSPSALARRSFLTQVGTVTTILGAAAAAGVAPEAAAQSSAEPRWQPARHPQDDWLDQVPGKHRLVFDTTTPDGANWAATFATNFYTANGTGYNLQNADLAVVIVVRHNSTSFAYSDAIWGKYGDTISSLTSFVDPNTKAAPKVNVYNRQLDALVKRGLHLAVCQMATRRYAGVIAQAVGSTSDDIYNEIVANLLPNAHMVPAGIVALSRAQERGYTLAHAV